MESQKENNSSATELKVMEYVNLTDNEKQQVKNKVQENSETQFNEIWS